MTPLNPHDPYGDLGRALEDLRAALDSELRRTRGRIAAALVDTWHRWRYAGRSTFAIWGALPEQQQVVQPRRVSIVLRLGAWRELREEFERTGRAARALRLTIERDQASALAYAMQRGRTIERARTLTGGTTPDWRKARVIPDCG